MNQHRGILQLSNNSSRTRVVKQVICLAIFQYKASILVPVSWNLHIMNESYLFCSSIIVTSHWMKCTITSFNYSHSSAFRSSILQLYSSLLDTFRAHVRTYTNLRNIDVRRKDRRQISVVRYFRRGTFVDTADNMPNIVSLVFYFSIFFSCFLWV